MKNLFYLIIFFMVVSCSNNNVVYWCGDHPCINKKEKEAYFKKTMIVEIRDLKKSKTTDNSEIEKVMRQAKLEEKRRIKEEKDLAKQIKLEEKSRVKEDKNLTNKNKFKTKTSTKTVKADIDLENVSIDSTKFNELVEKIIKKNNFRSYPDINNIPN